MRGSKGLSWALLCVGVVTLCGCMGGAAPLQEPEAARDDGDDPEDVVLIDEGDPTPPPTDPAPPVGDLPVADPDDEEPLGEAECAPAEEPLEEPVDNPGLGSDGDIVNHMGENKQLEIEIAFTGESGQTVTDELGTHYEFFGMVIDEDKVYSSEYWGTFPLYFFGDAVGVTVTLDMSFVTEYDPSIPDMESGLDRFVVEIYHMNAGGNSGRDVAPITSAEGVFCPPEYTP